MTRSREVARALKKIDGVKSADKVTGPYAVIALIVIILAFG